MDGGQDYLPFSSTPHPLGASLLAMPLDFHRCISPSRGEGGLAFENCG